MKNIINNLPKKYRWTIHNLIAHPLMEIAFLLGKESLSQKIHDSTIPEAVSHPEAQSIKT